MSYKFSSWSTVYKIKWRFKLELVNAWSSHNINLLSYQVNDYCYLKILKTLRNILNNTTQGKTEQIFTVSFVSFYVFKAEHKNPNWCLANTNPVDSELSLHRPKSSLYLR